MTLRFYYMGNVEIANIEEYIICVMGLVGEIKVMGIGRTMPYTDTYILKGAASLVSNGFIRKYQYQDAKFYRLTEKGLLKLTEISPALASHFELICGDGNSRYKGTKDKQRKRRRLYETWS